MTVLGQAIGIPFVRLINAGGGGGPPAGTIQAEDNTDLQAEDGTYLQAD